MLRLLDLEGGWVQLAGQNNRLKLASSRGLTPDIERELVLMDSQHLLANQIIGLGQKIIVPDLAADGIYALPSFSRAGFRSLVAVPVQTYRAHGILGFASRQKNWFRNEVAELLTVLGSILIAVVMKAELYQDALARKTKRRAGPAESPVPDNHKSAPAVTTAAVDIHEPQPPAAIPFTDEHPLRQPVVAQLTDSQEMEKIPGNGHSVANIKITVSEYFRKHNLTMKTFRGSHTNHHRQ